MKLHRIYLTLFCLSAIIILSKQVIKKENTIMPKKVKKSDNIGFEFSKAISAFGGKVSKAHKLEKENDIYKTIDFLNKCYEREIN